MHVQVLRRRRPAEARQWLLAARPARRPRYRLRWRHQVSGQLSLGPHETGQGTASHAEHVPLTHIQGLRRRRPAEARQWLLAARPARRPRCSLRWHRQVLINLTGLANVQKRDLTAYLLFLVLQSIQRRLPVLRQLCCRRRCLRSFRQRHRRLNPQSRPPVSRQAAEFGWRGDAMQV
jgi:hypothetical protein